MFPTPSRSPMIHAGFALRLLFICTMLLGLESVSWGQPATKPAAPQRQRMNPMQRLRRIQENQAQTLQSFNAGNYVEAERLVREGWKLAPDDPTYPYNLACALAKQDKKPDALAALETCVKMGWHDAHKIRTDDDLAALRNEPQFKKVIDEARAKYQQALSPYEKGLPVLGTRVVEGNPDDGLRWRLRLSDKATRDKPHRLIVWLHPAGQTMNGQIERLAPEFAQHRLGLLVLTQKNLADWTDDDVQRLIEVTLPDVAKVEGVSAERPILLGMGEGGQAALAMYMEKPGQYGGLILNAAYPVRNAGFGRAAAAEPPKDNARRNVPIYALLGEDDPGSSIWEMVEKPWRDAGIPLSLRIVPGGNHQWLFGKPQLDDLHEWLEDVQSGKLPSGQETIAPSTKGVL